MALSIFNISGICLIRDTISLIYDIVFILLDISSTILILFSFLKVYLIPDKFSYNECLIFLDVLDRFLREDWSSSEPILDNTSDGSVEIYSSCLFLYIWF